MKDRIKQIRKYYDLSQAQFALKINMSPGFISNVEMGKSGVSEKTIEAICKTFPISKDWLIYGIGNLFTFGNEESPVDKSGIAYRVRTIRKRENLTQEEFGKRIGYSKMQIHAVETGKVIPSNHFLEKIVSEFKLSFNWMFMGEGKIESQECCIDDKLLEWLNEHPEVVKELRTRSGLN